MSSKVRKPSRSPTRVPKKTPATTTAAAATTATPTVATTVNTSAHRRRPTKQSKSTSSFSSVAIFVAGVVAFALYTLLPEARATLWRSLLSSSALFDAKRYCDSSQLDSIAQVNWSSLSNADNALLEPIRRHYARHDASERRPLGILIAPKQVGNDDDDNNAADHSYAARQIDEIQRLLRPKMQLRAPSRKRFKLTAASFEQTEF